MSSEPPIRTSETVLETLLRPWETVRSQMTYKEEDIKDLVKKNSSEITSLMEGDDTTSKLLKSDLPSEYFDDDDTLGQKFCRMYDLEHKLQNPSKFDSLLIDEESAGSTAGRMTSQLSGWDIGFWRSIVRTILLFLAVVPLAWAVGLNLRTDPAGAIILVICLATVTIGTEYWHRYVSYERPTCDEELSSYGRTTVRRLGVANVLAVAMLGGASLIAGTQATTFFAELVSVATLAVGVGIVLGIIGSYLGGFSGGAFGLLAGSVLVAFFETVSSRGPWVETLVPSLSFAHQLDVALASFVGATLLLTILGALNSYPATFWKVAYSPSNESPSGSPGFLTFLLLAPTVVFGWTLVGGTLPAFFGYAGPIAVAGIACTMPAITSLLHLLR